MIYSSPEQLQGATCHTESHRITHLSPDTSEHAMP